MIALHRVTESTVAAIDPGLVSNAAAIVFDDLIVAVDVGMRPYAARLFREALESTYRRPVRLVCVTHKHADHTFGLAVFKDATLFGSSRLASALEDSSDFSPEAREEWRKNDLDGGGWLDEVELMVPPLRFDERIDVAIGGKRAEFYHSGGHTDCSVYGYFPADKVLFSGDLVFAGMFPFAGDPTADPEVWMSTLRLWTTLPIDHVIPGHGLVSGPEEIARQLGFFESLKANTLAALEAGRGPEDILVPDVYPGGGEPWFVDKTLQHWHAYYRDRT